MIHLIRHTVFACLIVLGSFQTAYASGVFCLGEFEHTQYASLVGLARYGIECDDGKAESVEKAWSYSSIARERLYQTQGRAAAKKLGVARISKGTGEFSDLGRYDVYRTSGANQPVRVAILSRFVRKLRGEILEVIELNEAGKETRFPESKLSSMADLTNVDKIAAQEGMSRSGGISKSYYQFFVLYR